MARSYNEGLNETFEDGNEYTHKNIRSLVSLYEYMVNVQFSISKLLTSMSSLITRR